MKPEECLKYWFLLGFFVLLVPQGTTLQYIYTFAGSESSQFSGDGILATSATLYAPVGVAVDGAGNVYIADSGHHRVRKVVNKIITTIAGNGLQNFSGDGGAATLASLNNPTGVAVDSTGNVYIADSNNHRVRKVLVDGTIQTVAGTGLKNFSGDGGLAASATLNIPFGVAVDSAGNIFIADSGNNRIRKVTSGTITTVAGGGGSFGDGGPATSATLDAPLGVTVDSTGNIYIADSGNRVIREVLVDGTIITVPGSSKRFTGTEASPNATGVAIDKAGNIYISDSANHEIRILVAGTLTTIAGRGANNFSGDGGDATNAHLDQPIGVAVDNAGNIYIADSLNNRIRILVEFPLAAVLGGVFGGAGGLCFLCIVGCLIRKKIKKRKEMETELPTISSEGRIKFKNLKFLNQIETTESGELWLGRYEVGDVWIKKLMDKRIALMTATGERNLNEILDLVPHPNICQLLGVVSEINAPVCIVYEYVPENLYNYIRANTFWHSGSLVLKFATDIAQGMQHLHNNQIIHCNLSARNVMVRARPNGIIDLKIAGFGLQVKSAYWKSPEAKFSKPSDVWAYTCTLWEILSGGKAPIQDIALEKTTEVTKEEKNFPFRKEDCLEDISQVTGKLWPLMEKCWAVDPASRPLFEIICDTLQSLQPK